MRIYAVQYIVSANSSTKSICRVCQLLISEAVSKNRMVVQAMTGAGKVTERDIFNKEFKHFDTFDLIVNAMMACNQPCMLPCENGVSHSCSRTPR